MVRLSVGLIERARVTVNPLKERELNLRGYSIQEIANLGATRDDVDAINLSDNIIRKLHNVPLLKRLKTISLGNNCVDFIMADLHKVAPNLHTLLLSGNSIASIREVEKLRGLKNLRTLSLEENPVAQTDNYRQLVIQALPQLIFLDFQRVTQAERDAVSVQGRGSTATKSSSSESRILPSSMNQAHGVMRRSEKHGGEGIDGHCGAVSSDSAQAAAPSFTMAEKQLIRTAILNAKSEKEVEEIQAAIARGELPRQLKEANTVSPPLLRATKPPTVSKEEGADVDFAGENVESDGARTGSSNISGGKRKRAEDDRQDASREGVDDDAGHAEREEAVKRAKRDDAEDATTGRSSSDAPRESESRKTLAKWTVKKLRAELKNRGCDASGRKKDLVERLAVAIAGTLPPNSDNQSTEKNHSKTRKRPKKGSEEELDEASIAKMTVKQIKAELKRRGVAIKGRRKADFVAALAEVISK